jgi:hypothetical protein
MLRVLEENTVEKFYEWVKQNYPSGTHTRIHERKQDVKKRKDSGMFI